MSTQTMDAWNEKKRTESCAMPLCERIHTDTINTYNDRRPIDNRDNGPEGVRMLAEGGG